MVLFSLTLLLSVLVSGLFFYELFRYVKHRQGGALLLLLAMALAFALYTKPDKQTTREKAANLYFPILPDPHMIHVYDCVLFNAIYCPIYADNTAIGVAAVGQVWVDERD